MIVGLIISVISVFIVVGVATTVYVQNSKQQQVFDKKLSEVVTKTNNANQYEYEKNKDQEVSLDKVRADVIKYDAQMAKLRKDFDYSQTQNAQQFKSMGNNMNHVSKQVSNSFDKVKTINDQQTAQLSSFNSDLTTTKTDIQKINDQVTVINGQLVNIGQKQQSQIDELSKDSTLIKKEHGELKDYIGSVAATSSSGLTTQAKSLADFQKKTEGTLLQQNESIAKIYNTANSVENIVATLNNALENVKYTFNDYVSKIDIKAYATKTDLQNVNTNFSNYLTNTDFNTFKTNLPDYPTRGEMTELVNSFITKNDIASINDLIGTTQKTLNDINGIVNNIKDTYATKNDLLKVTGDTTQGTVNIQSLFIALEGVKNNLVTMQEAITTAKNALTSYKTDADGKFATKTELTNLQNTLSSQLGNLQGNTASILDTLIVNKSMTAKGDLLLNDIKLSKGWSAYTDGAADRSEISNDTGTYKKLMIVGNKSGGAERRVGVWDRLDVHGSMNVDARADAQNILARDSIKVGSDGNKGWMMADGSMYSSGKLGVGMSPADAFMAKKQVVAKGGAADDWQLAFNNPNGDRWMYANHGDGNGIHIKTNDARADRYALELHNGSKQLMGVYNDGNINVDRTIRVQQNDPGPMIQKVYNGDGNRYGFGQWANGTVRSYAAGDIGGASINMSIANANGSFDDILKASKDNVSMNKDLRVNANNVCLQDQCLTTTDFQKVKTGSTSTSTNAIDKTVDNWKTSSDGANRFYFANNNRTYFGSKNGYEYRNAADQAIKRQEDDGREFSWGKNANDWNSTKYNPNGGVIYQNHGQGYGMHINTNNQQGGKYGLEVHNGTRPVFRSMNDNVAIVGNGPAWQPGDNLNATGTIMHADGQIRSRNTTEGDWVHKLYGQEHKNIHMIHNAGYGMHINTRNNEAGKYALETYNLNGPTFHVWNNGDASVYGRLRVNRATNEAYPNGWGNGVHSWDVYANGTVGAGASGQVASYINSGGTVYGRDWMRTDTGYYIQNGSAWLRNDGTVRGHRIQLGDKWILSGSGDAHGNDQWVRLHNVQDWTNNTGNGNYILKNGGGGNGNWGGIAAGTFWNASGSYQSSDMKLKDNISPINKSDIEKIDKLNPVEYTLKADANKVKHFGLIAQEVEKVYPNIVTNGPDNVKGVDYVGVVPLVVGKVNRLNPNKETLCLDDVCITKEDLLKLKKQT